MHINDTCDNDSSKQCQMSGNSLTPAVLLALTTIIRDGGLLLGPYSSETKGEVGNHGTDEATPVETELPS